ncbi:MAG: SRPBCC family protein [Acidobacteria bacterium]|nr:SRPBCC family protein [Acidobacteriota bacterium]
MMGFYQPYNGGVGLHMEHGIAVACSVEIEASCGAVFDVIHDYGIRLRWDTLLSKACIVDEGVTVAGVGVKTLCVGRAMFGEVGVETVYVSFQRGRVAAVKMTRGPWFLEDFAASMVHAGIPSSVGERSRVTYSLRIAARPRWLRFVMNPILRVVFRVETGRRLAGLKRYVEKG